MSLSIAPSLISREGRCGRKSLPTKKHMNTQSSIALYTEETIKKKETEEMIKKKEKLNAWGQGIHLLITATSIHN